MCGIVGVVDLRGAGRVPDGHTFDRMVDALARRGPDGRGVWRDANAAFGHRRLSIIDTSTASSQPMVKTDERGTVALVFNGEIYNYRALRTHLEGQGHRFSTAGDTEVLLAAWREWGERCVDRLDGIFAFVVKDGDRVFAARDHFGIKPLYVCVDDGVFSFASELKALLADGRKRKPSLEALDCVLTLGYVPVPLSPFEGIAQIPPATTWSMTLSASTASASAPRASTYWQPRPAERRISLRDASAELSARLGQVVHDQMVSDVPLGAFLSGGLDSSSVVEAMCRSSGDVRTFSMGFAEASFDESDDAAHTARALGTRHTTERVTHDLVATLTDVADTNDDLLADASLLSVDRLCAMARKHVTVALSGDGADEILAGYETYAATYVARAFRTLVPGPVRALALRATGLLPVSTARYNIADVAWRFFGSVERGVDVDGADFASFRIYFDDDLRRSVVKPAFRAEGRAIARYAERLHSAPGDTLLKRMLIADLQHYLPSDMLVKTDRASMRHGLEVRVPFLAPSFVDFALSLPSTLLLSPTGTTKVVLRDHVQQRVSARIAHGKKRGFNTPVGAALKGPLGAFARDTFNSEALRDTGPFDVDALLGLLTSHERGERDLGYPLYVALVAALWWKRFAL